MNIGSQIKLNTSLHIQHSKDERNSHRGLQEWWWRHPNKSWHRGGQENPSEVRWKGADPGQGAAEGTGNIHWELWPGLNTLFRICPFQALGFMAGMVVPVGLLLYITLYVSCRSEKNNKTEYFRLCLSYEWSVLRVLRERWEKLEDLSQKDEDLRQKDLKTDGHMNIVTPWAPDRAKKND